MENLFLTVLRMSATAAVVILAVLLARLLLRRAPKIFSYALWAVALFRLLCPVSISSGLSLLPAVQTQPAGEAQTSVHIHTGIAAMNSQVNDYLDGHPYPVEFTPSEREGDIGAVYLDGVSRMVEAAAPSWTAVACPVWLAGAVILLGYSVISMLRLRRKLVGWVPLEGEKNVRLADHIPSPFVLGVFRPKIYLPSGLPEGERDYILLHERTHIRRGDHILQALAWLAVAVHWFNPLVWLAFHLAGKDMEMSCDEAVLRKMGRDVRADYSSSLLRLSTGKRLPAGPLAFGDGDPQSRIKNVLRWKKPALWVVVIALIAVLCAGVALATNPGAVADSPDPGSGLTFTLYQTEGRPYVRIGGAVLGHTLGENTIWRPSLGAEEEYAGYRGLTMEYTFESGPGRVYAWWADEGRTSVAVSTEASTIAISSIVNWWEFTVDLSGGQGTVTSMETRCREGEPSDRLRTMPGAVSDAEAVDVARIAARLLTAAEDWYLRQGPVDSAPAELTISMNEDGTIVRMNGTVYGVAQEYACWFTPAWYEQYEEEPLGKLRFDMPLCDGEAVCPLDACWTDRSQSAVKVTATPRALISSYAPAGNLIFTVALEEDGGTLLEMEGHIPKMAQNAPELVPTEAEAIRAAQVAAKLLTAAEGWYLQQIPANGGDMPGRSQPERVWSWGSSEDTPDKVNWDMEEWARDNGIHYQFSQQDIDSAIAAARAYVEEEWAKEGWVISFEVISVYEARLETLHQWFMSFDRASTSFTDWTQEDMQTRYIVIGVDYTCEYDHTLTFMFDGEQQAAIELTRPTAEGEWSVHDAYSLPVLDRIINHWGGNPSSPAPGDVWMEVEAGTATPTGMRFLIDNETEETLTLEEGYSLQVEENGAWRDVGAGNPADSPVSVSTMEAHRSMSLPVDWGDWYGELPPGHYRMVKKAALGPGREAITLTAEFEITA